MHLVTGIGPIHRPVSSSSSGICCSTRSQSPASSWWRRCVTSNKRTRSSEASRTAVRASRRLPVSFLVDSSGWVRGSLWRRVFVPTGKRPFGVSLLYMGWDQHYGFQLYQSDPSGNYGGWKATCIGNNSAVSLQVWFGFSRPLFHRVPVWRVPGRLKAPVKRFHVKAAELWHHVDTRVSNSP